MRIDKLIQIPECEIIELLKNQEYKKTETVRNTQIKQFYSCLENRSDKQSIFQWF